MHGFFDVLALAGLALAVGPALIVALFPRCFIVVGLLSLVLVQRIAGSVGMSDDVEQCQGFDERRMEKDP